MHVQDPRLEMIENLENMFVVNPSGRPSNIARLRLKVSRDASGPLKSMAMASVCGVMAGVGAGAVLLMRTRLSWLQRAS
jgi:hypothetical protein